jgi:hypothetical protein
MVLFRQALFSIVAPSIMLIVAKERFSKVVPAIGRKPTTDGKLRIGWSATRSAAPRHLPKRMGLAVT